MISLDYTVAFQVVLFLILWFILSRVLFRPYLNLLEERERRTTGTERETAELVHEGERLRAQYEEKVAQAHAAGHTAKESILQDARQQRESLISQARVEASGMLNRVRQELQDQMRKERELAAVEAAAVAQELVGKILGRRLG